MVQMKGPDNQKGAALAALLVFGATLLLLGTALLRYSVNERIIANYQEEDVRLYYLAEAGLEAGLAALRRDFAHREQMSGTLGGGSFSVSFTALDPHLVRISSFGALGRNRKTVTLNAEQRLPAGLDRLSATEIALDNASIVGNVSVQGPLTAEQGANRIAGELRYGKDNPPLLGPRATLEVTGSTEAAEQQPATPQVNFELLAARAQQIIAGAVISLPPAGYPAQRHFLVEGDLTIAPRAGETFAFSGLLYVRGDLHIYPSAGSVLLLEGVLAAEGSVFYQPWVDDGTAVSTGTLLILAGSDITISPASGADGQLSGKQILYSRSAISLQGCPAEPLLIHGAALTRRLNLKFCTLVYEPELWQVHLADLPGLGEIRADWLR